MSAFVEKIFPTVQQRYCHRSAHLDTTLNGTREGQTKVCTKPICSSSRLTCTFTCMYTKQCSLCSKKSTYSGTLAATDYKIQVSLPSSPVPKQHTKTSVLPTKTQVQQVVQKLTRQSKLKPLTCSPLRRFLPVVSNQHIPYADPRSYYIDSAEEAITYIRPKKQLQRRALSSLRNPLHQSRLTSRTSPSYIHPSLRT